MAIKRMNKQVPLAILIAIGAYQITSCRRSSEGERARRDVEIGKVEVDSFSLESRNGHVHVLETQSASATLRASVPEFELVLVRKEASLAQMTLTLTNVPASLMLVSDAGILSATGEPVAGSPVAGKNLTSQWTVTFPTGMDAKVTLKTQINPVQDFEFLALGDIQNAIPKFGDMIDEMNKESNAEFLLIMGDLASGTRVEEYEQLAEHFSKFKLPVYTTPGNHDAFAPDIYQNYYGRTNFSMEYRGARFTSVDSASAELDVDVWNWLEDWFDDGKDQLHIVFSHIPPFEYSGVRSGQWNSRRLARKFISMAAKGRVDLFLFGHIHSYYEYTLAGVPTVISGGGGAIPEKFDKVGRHFLRLNAKPASQEITYEMVQIDPEGTY